MSVGDEVKLNTLKGIQNLADTIYTVSDMCVYDCVYDNIT